MPHVRPATIEEVEPLAQVLARAFREDPFQRWIFPRERARARGSRRTFALALRSEIEHGTVLTTDELQGVAIWRDPQFGLPSLRETLGAGLELLPLVRARSPLVFAGFQRLLRNRPSAPHWYLSILGTDPEHQRSGVGAALLLPMLERCDQRGTTAYLEASRAENVPYYERFGFVAAGEFRMPAGPPLWRMLREPLSKRDRAHEQRKR